MRRVWRDSVRVAVMALVSASLAWVPALTVAQSQSGSDQVSNGAGQTTADTAKNGGKGTGEAGGGSGPGSKEVGDRLHDSAKSFGDALLGGIKYAGRTVIGFFTGDKPKE